MRRLLTLATVLVIACGSPSGPEPPEDPTGTPSLAIVSGDNQEVTVTDTLPFDAEVQVMRGGNPVPDQLVDWRVLEDNAGEPFVTTTRTDSKGFTSNRVIAGTRAHTHPDMDGSAHMEVRWIEQSSGDAIVDTTVTFRVLPGVLDRFHHMLSGGRIEHGDTVDTGSLLQSAEDPFGNPIPLDSVRALPDSAVGWQWEDAVAGSSARGPSGGGWAATVDTTALLNQGYAVIKTPVMCGDGSDGTTRELSPGLTFTIRNVPSDRVGYQIRLSTTCE